MLPDHALLSLKDLTKTDSKVYDKMTQIDYMTASILLHTLTRSITYMPKSLEGWGFRELAMNVQTDILLQTYNAQTVMHKTWM